MKKIDSNLLFLMAENSRLKLNEASGMLRKSPQRLKYSQNIFLKSRILSVPHALIDYSFFGQLLFKVYYKGGYLSSDEKKVLADRIAKNPYIVSLYSLEGEYDFVLEIQAPNPSRFNKEIRTINNILKTLPENKVILNVVSHIYSRAALPKNPLLPDNFQREFVIGGDRPVKSFSNEEMKILRGLIENPLKPMTFLAREAQLHINTYKKHLQGLFDQKILRSFRYVLGVQELEMERVRLLVNLHSSTEQEKEDMLAFFLQKKQVVQASWTVGDWNLEIDIETMNRPQLRRLMLEIRQQFKNLIKTIQVVDVNEFYKRDYLPQYLFS